MAYQGGHRTIGRGKQAPAEVRKKPGKEICMQRLQLHMALPFFEMPGVLFFRNKTGQGLVIMVNYATISIIFD